MKTLRILIATMICAVSGVSNLDAITIAGKVYDENEKPLQGVFVRAFANDGTRVAETHTNADGEYRFEVAVKVPIDMIEYDRQGYFSGIELNISHQEPSTINKVVYTNPEGPLSFRNAYATSLGLRMILILRGGAPQPDWLENLREKNEDRYVKVKANRAALAEEIEGIDGQLAKLEALANKQSEAGEWSKSQFSTLMAAVRSSRSMARQIRGEP